MPREDGGGEDGCGEHRHGAGEQPRGRSCGQDEAPRGAAAPGLCHLQNHRPLAEAGAGGRARSAGEAPRCPQASEPTLTFLHWPVLRLLPHSPELESVTRTLDLTY